MKMFNVGFSEVLIVFLVSLALFEPKKLPSMIKHAKLYYTNFVKMRYKVIQLLKDININEFYDDQSDAEVKRIIGNDGNLHESYDIKDIISENKKDYDSKDSSSR